MSWENWLAYACLSENFFNLFCMVFMANEMYPLREWKAETSYYEKQKCCTFRLIVQERGRGISVKIRECYLSLLHYSPLWQCNNFTQNSRKSQESYLKISGKVTVNFLGEKVKGLSDFYLFSFIFFSCRLFIQVCGHIFIIRILLLALRQSIQGCGHTTSVQIRKRIWMAGSGLWIKLLLCKHALHWRGKFNTQTVRFENIYICVYIYKSDWWWFLKVVFANMCMKLIPILKKSVN